MSGFPALSIATMRLPLMPIEPLKIPSTGSTTSAPTRMVSSSLPPTRRPWIIIPLRTFFAHPETTSSQ